MKTEKQIDDYFNNLDMKKVKRGHISFIEQIYYLIFKEYM